MASALLARFGRRIVISDHDGHGWDRTISDPSRGDDISVSDQSADEPSMSWIRIARETQEARRHAEQEAQGRAEEVEQLLARGRTAA